LLTPTSQVPFLRSFLPTSLQDFAMDMLGINNSMDNFKGRKGQ
jgi:hypothetical protein